MDGKHPFLEQQRTANRRVEKVANMCFGTLESVLKILERVHAASEKGTTPSWLQIGEGLQKLLRKTRDQVQTSVPSETIPLSFDRHVDFQYSQDRVHSFSGSATPEGLFPVQRLQIWHNAFRKQGDLSKYPWTIKIENGKARVSVQPTGATSFQANSMTDVETAFINISDADMFRMMSRVTHYIYVWEQVVASEVVRKGLEQREKERQNWMQSKKEAV